MVNGTLKKIYFSIFYNKFGLFFRYLIRHCFICNSQISLCRRQCSRSVTFWYGAGCGSGSSNPYLWLSVQLRPWIRIRILHFSSVTFKTQTKNIFMLISFWRYITSSFKHKKSRRSHKPVEIKVFLHFLLRVDGRIRIRNTGRTDRTRRMLGSNVQWCSETLTARLDLIHRTHSYKAAPPWENGQPAPPQVWTECWEGLEAVGGGGGGEGSLLTGFRPPNSRPRSLGSHLRPPHPLPIMMDMQSYNP
jgi:hypothetical protein